MKLNRLRRLAVLVAVGAVFAAMVPSAPASAFVPCRTIVGPLMYGIGTGPEYGVCVNVIVGGQQSNSLTIGAGVNPTGSGQPAYVMVSDSVCTPGSCVFAGAGITKNGLSVGPYAYVCYIDQLGNGFCVPDFDPALLNDLLKSLAIDTATLDAIKAAIASLDVDGAARL